MIPSWMQTRLRPPHNAVFLVDGALNFKPGPVQTVFHGWTKLIPNSSLEDNSIRLSLGLSDDAMQGSFYSLALKKFDRGERTHYALSLFESGSQISQKIQLFEHCCDGTYPALLWAGDLDRDRKLDLLINATNHYNVTHPMLFLSSQAEEGRLVEAVAELRSVGC